MGNYNFSHLEELESESIFVLRESVAQFENPVLLFSGGKDSILTFHLARKAFYPAQIPFSLLHIDTGHNFPETLVYIDQLVKKYNIRLVVGSVQKAIDRGELLEEKGCHISRIFLQTHVLLASLEHGGYDAALGGGRRDEEKSRAKERFFSHRDKLGQWNPGNQRPELWNLFNGRKHPGEHFRVFPISNWTELDVWLYLSMEKIPLPSLYFAHKRKVIKRGNILLADCDYMPRKPTEEVMEMMVRCRTIGDMTCTGLWESTATDIEAIIQEVAIARKTERGGRVDDKRSETAMEDRKKQGYF